jgi:translation elongation factor EF-1beta
VATRRRARRKSLTANITDIQRRLRYVESKPNPSRLTNQVVNRNAIQFNAVATDQIAPNAVTTSEIAPDAVTNDQLASNSVTNDNLADDSVDNSNLQNGSVGTNELADNAVTTAKLANNSVTSDKIVNGTIVGADIASNTIGGSRSGTTSKFIVNSIGQLDIDDAAIGSNELINLAVTTGKLAAGAVTTSKILDSQVTVNKLNFAPITNITSGSGISVTTTGPTSVVGTLGRTISASFGTGSTNVARGNHTHGVSGSTSRNLNHSHSISGTASSKKFKKDIELYELSEEDVSNILNLKLSKFKYRNEVKDFSSNREWNYGYIAEDVEENALEQIVSYNNEKEPIAIDYGLLSAFVLEIVKQQKEEIESLKKRLSELEGA